MTLLVVVAAPLGGAIFLALAGGRLGRWTLGLIATGAMALSFGAAASMVGSIPTHPRLEAHVAGWLPIPGADLALVADSSTLAISLMITGVSALISLYSIGYLTNDRGLQRYFAALDLFVASMLLIVLASNLVLLFAGWELVGLCSYLLIGHFRERPAAADAAVKAFVVNRVGDAAFLVGIFLLLAAFHTVDIAQLDGIAIEHGSMNTDLLVVASGLLLFGALAKSAQFPLHTWLPDAMEGPMPVSALIHAATMVTAGVVLLVRMRSLLAADVLFAASVIGAVTALGAAIVALGQRDLKRVLAWSTISQVGLMFVGAGLGATFAARFHLLAHAFFKGTLFLAAGSVMHATADELDIGRLGGLGRRMRWTTAAFAAGTLALAAIPPTAGFFSKDHIAAAAVAAPALLVAVLLTSAVSALYALRLFVTVFVAPASVEREAHESPMVMVIPLVLLALAAVSFGGLVSAGIVPIGGAPGDEPPIWLAATSFAIALGGAATGWLVYRHGLERAERVERVTARAAGGFGLDPLYSRVLVRPFRAAARELERGAERLNQRSIDALALAVAGAGIAVRRIQGGYVRGYEALLLAGTVALLAYWNWNAR
ncbi:MAG TPA: NADH-quinone oxidoreductase subunit L [Candidatus Limnocylindria bacterium]|nr:NADH-quinone oxidoreductase subunit L [Candidatus Limnocylindria bacterium]